MIQITKWRPAPKPLELFDVAIKQLEKYNDRWVMFTKKTEREYMYSVYKKFEEER